MTSSYLSDINYFRHYLSLPQPKSPTMLSTAHKMNVIGSILENLLDYAGIRDKTLRDLLHSALDPNVVSLQSHDFRVDEFTAIINIAYLTLNASAAHGFPFDDGWRRVHAANLKMILDSTTSTAIRPPDWSPPHLADLV